ncbi:MAG: Tyrosine-protein phosphatase YwqE [Dehalococcoidia bacterium]|nr:Tyrosine-protein phosphatase YwqE [Bacillota bacterium]
MAVEYSSCRMNFVNQGESMHKFVDIHCHILPGVDDGPVTTEQSLEMAKALADAGFNQVIATPHVADDQSAEYHALIRKKHKLLTEALCEADIPLSISLGAEILFSPEVLQLAKAESLPTLSGTPYALIELPYYQAITSYTFEALFSLRVMGYRPILAHPERVEAIKSSFEILPRLVKAGVLLQVNLGSLVGYFGQRAQRIAEKMVSTGLAHLLATDCHDASMLPRILPLLRENTIPIDILLKENPTNLLAGKPIEIAIPEETLSYKEKIRRFFSAS